MSQKSRHSKVNTAPISNDEETADVLAAIMNSYPQSMDDVETKMETNARQTIARKSIRRSAPIVGRTNTAKQNDERIMRSLSRSRSNPAVKSAESHNERQAASKMRTAERKSTLSQNENLLGKTPDEIAASGTVDRPSKGSPGIVIADTSPATSSKVSRSKRPATIVRSRSAARTGTVSGSKYTNMKHSRDKKVRDHLEQLGYAIDLDFSTGGEDPVTVAVLARSSLGQRVIIRFRNPKSMRSKSKGLRTTYIPTEAPFVVVTPTEQKFVPDNVRENYRLTMENANTNYGFLVRTTDGTEGVCFISKQGTRERCWQFAESGVIPDDINPGDGGTFALSIVRYDQLRDAQPDDNTIWDILNRPTGSKGAIQKDFGTFNIFTRLIRIAGLESELRSAELTVLVPNDEAFDDIDPGTLATLKKRENHNQLVNILLYHIYKGSKDINSVGDTVTLQGEGHNWNRTGTTITVNNADVLAAGYRLSNGIVHVISEVLMPRHIVNLPISSRLVQEVDYNTIDESTTLLRTAASKLVETQNNTLRELAESVATRIEQVTSAVDDGAYGELANSIIKNTRKFTAMSKSKRPEVSSQAPTLNAMLSTDNQKFDAIIASQQRSLTVASSLQDIMDRLDNILSDLRELALAQPQ